MAMTVTSNSNAAAGVVRHGRRFDHAYFTAMSVAMAAIVGAGFSRTYFQRIADGTTTPLIHLHGGVFALWMVLVVVQTVLVSTGNTRLHRHLGVAGVFFAAVMLAIGAVTCVIAARHGFHGNPPGPVTPLSFLLVAPVRDMLVFGSLVGAAIVLNRDVQSHKRLMVMATLGGLVPAGLSRLTGAGPTLVGVFVVLLLLGPAYDWVVHRRVYGAYVWGIAVTILTTAACTILAETSIWQSFARSLVQ